MALNNSAFLAFMEEQRVDYRNMLPQRLEQINLLWHQVLKGEKVAEALPTLERCAHSLAGSGATFGFADLGDAARVLELMVHPLVNAGIAITGKAQADITQAIELLQRSLPDEAGLQGARS